MNRAEPLRRRLVNGLVRFKGSVHEELLRFERYTAIKKEAKLVVRSVPLLLLFLPHHQTE